MKKKKGIGKFNIADWFSFYRIISVPLLLLLIFFEHRTIFTWFLLLSFTTDIVDGILSRKLHIQSERGTKLDSLGDLLTLIMAVLGLIRFEWDFLKMHALPVLLLLIFYFLEMGIALIRYHKLSSFHTYMSKITFLIQGVFILYLLFFGDAPVLFYTAVITGIIGSLEEMLIILFLPQYRSNVKGLYWVLKERKRRS
jgi:phosphatidylglycerophosphate synthase